MGRRSGNRPVGPEAPSGGGKLRLDKWIWFARFLRTREASAELVRAGHVRLNARKVLQPGSFVGIGDILTLALPGKTVVVEITALAERREGSMAAAGLYAQREPAQRPPAKND